MCTTEFKNYLIERLRIAQELEANYEQEDSI